MVATGACHHVEYIQQQVVWLLCRGNEAFGGDGEEGRRDCSLNIVTCNNSGGMDSLIWYFR